MSYLTARTEERIDHLERERAIVTVAAPQLQLITAAQLVRCGLSRSGIKHRVDNLRYFVSQPTVYSLAGKIGREDMPRRCMAAVLAGPAGTAIAGPTALGHARLGRFRMPTDHVHVELPCRSDRRFIDVRSKQSQAQATGHVGLLRGMPTTDLAWTITSLGDHLTAPQICHVIHQAAKFRRVDPLAVQRLLDERLRVPGRAGVRDALAAYHLGSAGTRSFLEDRFLDIVARILGRRPIPNLHVEARVESFEVDVPLLEFRGLCLEVDGPPHDEPGQMIKDRARDAALTAAGYRVARFHWTDIERRPEWCERRLRELLAA